MSRVKSYFHIEICEREIESRDPPSRELPQLCPFGVSGDEPLATVDGRLQSVREAVWRGYLSREEGREIYPQGDWSVLDKHA